MDTSVDNRAQRQATAVLRLETSRTRLRTALINPPRAQGAMAGVMDQFSRASAWVAALVQQHPGLSATGAVLLGALLVKARPWRLAVSTGLWALLVPRVLPTLVTTLTAARLGVWSDLIVAWLRDGKQPPEPSDPLAQASTRAS